MKNKTLIIVVIIVVLLILSIIGLNIINNKKEDEPKVYAGDACFDFDEETGTIDSYFLINPETKERTVCSLDVVIPSKINDVAVTSIKNGAFIYLSITSVLIPDTVINIGASAFSYNILTEVVIPSSVKNIEAYAFSHNSLTEVKIPSSVKNIENHAFFYNNINKIIIDSSETIIGNNLLTDNDNFKNAYTANGAGTYIGAQTGDWTK
jgi:hypothetical protein